MVAMILLIVLGVVVMVTGIVTLVLRLTKGVADGGRSFFAALSAEPAEAVWSGRTTDRFRRDVPLSEFEEVVTRFNLKQARAASWNSRASSGSYGRLKGRVTTAKGTLKVVVDLQRNQGVWLVDQLNLVPLG